MEILLYLLFLVLFVFGAWSLLSSWSDLFSKKQEVTYKRSAQSEIGDLDGEEEQDDTSQPRFFSPPGVLGDQPGMTETANAARQRIEREHRSIMEDVIREVLTANQPTPFESIYGNYVEKCNAREVYECERRLDKPRVRHRVKAYLREFETDGKVKRVLKGREYFYAMVE